MKNSTLIQIIKSIKDNNGKFPSEYEPLIPELKDLMIIWHVNQSNGRTTAELSPAQEIYYQQFEKMNCGSWASCLLWTIYIHIFEPGDIAMWQRNVKEVEKIKKKLMHNQLK